MKSKCKTVLYLILCFTLCIHLPVHAGALQVSKFSNPIKVMNKISQPINLSFISDGNWRVLVEPLDTQIRNLDNPNYTIPITRMELAEMNGMPISNFNVGRALEIKSGNYTGMSNLNLALNIIHSDADYPGNYVTDVKFTLMNNNNIVGEDIYTLRFTQDEIASIDFSRRMLNLKMDKDKVLQKNSSQNLAYPFSLYIASNKNWKLYVRPLSSSNNNTDKKLKYFVKVLGSGDNTVTCNQTSEYFPLQQDIPVLIASGKATINQNTSSLDKKIINVDYMVRGPENTFIPAGSKTEEFEYRLETEK